MNNPLKIAAFFIASLSCYGMIAMQKALTPSEKFEMAETKLGKAIRKMDLQEMQAVIGDEPSLIQKGIGGVPLLKIVWDTFPATTKYAALEYLLKKGADAGQLEGYLLSAGATGNKDAFEKLLKLPVNFENKIEAIEGLLRFAMKKGDLDLIGYGLTLEPNAVKQIGSRAEPIKGRRTALVSTLAWVWNNVPEDKKYSVADYLLKKGADMKDIAHKLADAAEEPNVSAVKWLVTHGLSDTSGEILKSIKEKER